MTEDRSYGGKAEAPGGRALRPRSPSPRRAYSPELRLVAACLAWPRSPDRAEHVRRLSGDGVNWSRVHQLVRRHRVAGLVQHALVDAGVAPDPDIAARLARGAQETAFEELRISAELRRLLDALEGDEVQAVVLKGLSAAVQGFGRVGLRQNRDIDLLVSADDVPTTVRRLTLEGYCQVEPEGVLTASGLLERIRTHKDVVFNHPGRATVVEVHWRLFDNRDFAASMGDLAVTKLALPIGGEIDALSLESSLLFMSGHGAQHAWSRLKWLADFAACCTALGEEGVERLYNEVRRGGLGLAMAQGLLLAGELMDGAVPSKLSKDVATSWRLRALRRVGRHALGSVEETAELEDRMFGSTLKTLSHYLLSYSLSYLVAQLVLDASEPPSAHASPIARRLGPLAKAPLWIYDRLTRSHRR